MTRLLLALACTTLPFVAHAAPFSSADCILAPHSEIRLGAAARGMIDTVHVDRGDRMAKGQVLVELESSEERNRIELARIAVANDTAIELAEKRMEVARAKSDRMSRLGTQNLVTSAEVEEAKLEAEVAQLERRQAMVERELARERLRGAEAALERKTARAPFAGVVVDRVLSDGELYNEQEPLLILARIDPLHAETYLPASRIAEVARGMEVSLTLEAGGTATGRVIVVDPLLDAATGTFGIRIEVPNPDGKIPAGQRCEVTFRP